MGKDRAKIKSEMRCIFRSTKDSTCTEIKRICQFEKKSLISQQNTYFWEMHNPCFSDISNSNDRHGIYIIMS